MRLNVPSSFVSALPTVVPAAPTSGPALQRSRRIQAEIFVSIESSSIHASYS
jgi:hypothetical protein